jgi:hypothetical protein
MAYDSMILPERLHLRRFAWSSINLLTMGPTRIRFRIVVFVDFPPAFLSEGVGAFHLIFNTVGVPLAQHIFLQLGDEWL